MSSATHYKIYCNTEAKYVDGWGTSPPTACYNNNTHDVNLNSVQAIEVVSNDIVKIKEDSVVIPRNVWIQDIEFSGISPSTSQQKTFTFDIVTSMYSFSFVTDNDNRGDEFTIAVNPDTTLGLITQNVAIGDTTLHAPPGLLLYGWNGFELKLTDGVNTDDLGKIISINKETGVVTFTNPAEHNFSAANTLVQMTYYVMKTLKFGAPGVLKFGDDIIGGASPAIGTTVRFTYHNNTPADTPGAVAKNFVMYMTLLF